MRPLPGSAIAEVAAQRVAGGLGDLAGHLDAGRPGADHHERQPRRRAARGRGSTLGGLEGRRGCGRGWSARSRATSASARIRGPLVVAEVASSASRPRRSTCHRAPAPARADRRPTGGPPRVARGRSGRPPRAATCTLRLRFEHRAQRIRDLAGRQGAGRDLVGQRLEQVEVAPVDERDLHGGPPQSTRSLQPAEAAADDGDPVWAVAGVHVIAGALWTPGCQPPARARARALSCSNENSGVWTPMTTGQAHSHAATSRGFEMDLDPVRPSRAMSEEHISRGFTGRRRETVDPTRIPPGQYATRDFPVLSAGPTPHTPLDEWTFTIDGAVDAARTWTWEELLALPQETPTVDIHCVTKWSKLDTSWRGVSVDTLLAGRRHGGRVRHGLVRRWLYDQPRARGRHRGQGLGRPRVRRRAAGRRAWRPGAAPGPASVLLEEREVGAWPRADA